MSDPNAPRLQSETIAASIVNELENLRHEINYLVDHTTYIINRTESMSKKLRIGSQRDSLERLSAEVKTYSDNAKVLIAPDRSVDKLRQEFRNLKSNVNRCLLEK